MAVASHPGSGSGRTQAAQGLVLERRCWRETPWGWPPRPLERAPAPESLGRPACSLAWAWAIGSWAKAAGGPSLTPLSRSLCFSGSASILSCRPVKADPQGGSGGGGGGVGSSGSYHEAEENSSQGREELQCILLSPTLRYAGLEPFATKVQCVSRGGGAGGMWVGPGSSEDSLQGRGLPARREAGMQMATREASPAVTLPRGQAPGSLLPTLPPPADSALHSQQGLPFAKPSALSGGQRRCSPGRAVASRPEQSRPSPSFPLS